MENNSSDQKVMDLLSKLKNDQSVYPSELQAASTPAPNGNNGNHFGQTKQPPKPTKGYKGSQE
jgi:hypothetical protein